MNPWGHTVPGDTPRVEIPEVPREIELDKAAREAIVDAFLGHCGIPKQPVPDWRPEEHRRPDAQGSA